MGDDQSYVSGSEVTLPLVPRLPLSSLDDVTDDETLALTTIGRADYDEEAPSGRSRQDWESAGKGRKNQSAGNVFSDAVTSNPMRRRKSKIIRRSGSVDSMVSMSTSRSILKRGSVPNVSSRDRAMVPSAVPPAVPRGSVTDRHRRMSSTTTTRKVSFKGSHSEPLSSVELTGGRKKIVSFGSSIGDWKPELDPLSPVRPGAGGSGGGGWGGGGPSLEKGKGPMRRRESMMNMLRTELMKTNKLKVADRLGETTSSLDLRKEKSFDDIFTSRQAKPPLVKRQSMPILIRKDSARSSVSDDEVFMSNFDRRKLTLLTSLDRMGVKLPKRTKRNDSNVSVDEHMILKRAAKGQRHGSLTTRTILSKFDVVPVKKPVNQSPEEKLDDATRSKLQLIFDTFTKQDPPGTFPLLHGDMDASVTASIRDSIVGASTLNGPHPWSRNSVSPQFSDTRDGSENDRAHGREPGHDTVGDTGVAPTPQDGCTVSHTVDHPSPSARETLDENRSVKTNSIPSLSQTSDPKRDEAEISKKPCSRRWADSCPQTIRTAGPQQGCSTAKDPCPVLCEPLLARHQNPQRRALSRLRAVLYPGKRGTVWVSRGGGGIGVPRVPRAAGRGGRQVVGEAGGHDEDVSSSSRRQGMRTWSSCRAVLLTGTRLATRRRLMKRKNNNRFRNLSKFICLLLRAWRVHSLAVSAILEFHQTVEVTLDNQGKDTLLFYITEYKANTEARLSKETIRILKKRPAERKPEEIHYVQVALWNYKSLAEYPVHMQRMIAERAWIESCWLMMTMRGPEGHQAVDRAWTGASGDDHHP
ncbi:hypothetical protein ACOMHN_061185 [Nucella lapillus]